jgi:hypothetical protein
MEYLGIRIFDLQGLNPCFFVFCDRRGETIFSPACKFKYGRLHGIAPTNLNSNAGGHKGHLYENVCFVFDLRSSGGVL